MDIVGFIQSNGINSVLWIFAVLGVFKVFGKQLGQALVKFAMLGEKQIVDSIPSDEIKANAQVLIKQAESWMVSADGQSKMEWVVTQICKGFPVIESVVKPIAQAAYDEVRAELNKGAQK